MGKQLMLQTVVRIEQHRGFDVCFATRFDPLQTPQDIGVQRTSNPYILGCGNALNLDCGIETMPGTSGRGTASAVAMP